MAVHLHQQHWQHGVISEQYVEESWTVSIHKAPIIGLCLLFCFRHGVSRS